MRVAFGRNVASIADVVVDFALAHSLEGIVSGVGHDVFFQHRRAKIVNAKLQRYLANLRALRDPRGLQMLEIVQHQTRHGGVTQIFGGGCAVVFAELRASQRS